MELIYYYDYNDIKDSEKYDVNDKIYFIQDIY